MPRPVLLFAALQLRGSSVASRILKITCRSLNKQTPFVFILMLLIKSAAT